MIPLAVVAIAAILVLLAIIVLNSRDFMTREDKWNQERQILLNRIQDPEYQPPVERLTPAEKRQNMEELQRLQEEAEQYGLVGQIVE